LLNNIGIHFLGKHYDTDMNDFTRYMGISKEMIQTLRPYHFIVKKDGASASIIRSPKGLLGKSPRMYRQAKKIKELIELQLDNYYQHRNKKKNIHKQQTCLKPKF